MRSQIFTDPSVPVTSRAILCGVYAEIVERMQFQAVEISAKGGLPLKFDEMCGIASGKVYELEPETDLPFLFAAMKLRGLLVFATPDCVQGQQEAAQHVFRMVRDAAKGRLAEDVFKRLNTFVSRKCKEGAPFSEEVYSELCAILGHD
jgi:hypothetical protein